MRCTFCVVLFLLHTSVSSLATGLFQSWERTYQYTMVTRVPVCELMDGRIVAVCSYGSRILVMNQAGDTLSSVLLPQDIGLMAALTLLPAQTEDSQLLVLESGRLTC